MAEIRTADIVLSLTGRDRGQLMLVVAEEGDFLLLANGYTVRAVSSVDNRGLTLPVLPDEGKQTESGYPIGNDVTACIEIRKALALWTGDENAN